MNKVLFNTLKITTLIALCSFGSCNTTIVDPKPEDILPEFEGGVVIGLINNSEIEEASGMVASRSFEGMHWVHNDSGDRNRIFLIDNKANWKGNFYLDGAINRDWEDIAVAKMEDGNNYIFVGDIGDNNSVQNNKYFIYMIKEPTSMPQNGEDVILNNLKTIAFSYPDGSKDAETLLVDQQTKDIYIISKSINGTENIYIIPFPYSYNTNNEAKLLGKMQVNQATAGDISITNDEILIKNYFQIFYWKLKKNETIKQALLRTYDKTVPYKSELQGEAITFGVKNEGYYTMSETTPINDLKKVFYYKKK